MVKKTWIHNSKHNILNMQIPKQQKQHTESPSVLSKHFFQWFLCFFLNEMKCHLLEISSVGYFYSFSLSSLYLTKMKENPFAHQMIIPSWSIKIQQELMLSNHYIFNGTYICATIRDKLLFELSQLMFIYIKMSKYMERLLS